MQTYLTNAHTYLVVGNVTELASWAVPEDYRRACASHVGRGRVELYLPWLLYEPAFDERIHLTDMPMPLDVLKRTGVLTHYSARNGSQRNIYMSPPGPASLIHVDLRLLLCASDAGFMFKAETAIREALRSKGLPTSLEEYKAQEAKEAAVAALA